MFLLLLVLAQAPLNLRGLPVTITEPPPQDPESGFFPSGPATICAGVAPAQSCYTAPQDFGRYPKAEVIQIDKETPAILFSAASGGVSGYSIHYALLTQAADGKLQNLFPSRMKVADQSQHGFFLRPEISPAPIFVTADFVWDLNDSHHGAHRFVVSVYWIKKHLDGGMDRYALADRYMTVKRYERVDRQDNILRAEFPELWSRLRRVLLDEKMSRR